MLVPLAVDESGVTCPACCIRQRIFTSLSSRHPLRCQLVPANMNLLWFENSLGVLWFENSLGADVQHDRPVTNQTSGMLPAGVTGVLAHPAASSVAPPTHVVMPVPAPAAMTGRLLPSLPLHSPCHLPLPPSQPPSLCSMTVVMLTPCLQPIR